MTAWGNKEVVELLILAISKLWDGKSERGTHSWMYACDAVLGAGWIIDRATGRESTPVVKYLQRVIERQCLQTLHHSIDSACITVGIVEDADIQEVRRIFLDKLLTHYVESCGIEYPDNSILENVIQEFR